MLPRFLDGEMANDRLTMRKLKEVFRCHFEAGLSQRSIARSLNISHRTVGEYLKRAQAAGLAWPWPEDADEALIERRLFPPAAIAVSGRIEPDWAVIHQELKKKGLTLQLLWEEYRESNPDGYRYSRFCQRYRDFAGTLKRSMRQVHRAGEKLFVDYCGPTVSVVDRHSGEIRTAQIFVAVLGASSYTYAEATWTQSLPDWIGSHVRTFEFLAGLPEILVPDNLKSGVSRACRYEPDLNPTYQEMAAHYGVTVIPARPYKPKDKAKAEAGVLLVERWILARLRRRTFFSLAELNAAIRELLADLNHRAFKKLPGSRRSTFEAIDAPALKPLPASAYEYAEWKAAKPGVDYHVEVDGHYYSVPHALIGHKLDVRFGATTVECFHRGRRIASHLRSFRKGKHSTLAEHMPASHRKHQQWTPGRLLNWAGAIGPATLAVVKWQFDHKPHPEQGYRTCLGLLSLAKRYSEARLEAACARALAIGSPKRASVKSILESGFDQSPELFQTEAQTPSLLPSHTNIRGADYFNPAPLVPTLTGETLSCSSSKPSIH